MPPLMTPFTGVKGAFVEGCTYGVTCGLIYLAKALLFYVGMLLVAHKIYTHIQMIEFLNLVVSMVTTCSQFMAVGKFLEPLSWSRFSFLFLAEEVANPPNNVWPQQVYHP